MAYSSVKTSWGSNDAENSKIIAAGAAVSFPAHMLGLDPSRYRSEGGMVRINTTNPIGDAASRYNGPYNLSSPNWDRVQATIGEEVKLSVAIQSYPNAAVTFTIWKDGANRESELPIARLSVSSENGQAETKWRYVYNESEEGPLTEKPKFVFVALAFGCDPVESGVCEFGVKIDIELLDELEKIIKSMKQYKLSQSGQTRPLGEDGKIFEESAIPGETVLFVFNED